MAATVSVALVAACVHLNALAVSAAAAYCTAVLLLSVCSVLKNKTKPKEKEAKQKKELGKSSATTAKHNTKFLDAKWPTFSPFSSPSLSACKCVFICKCLLLPHQFSRCCCSLFVVQIYALFSFPFSFFVSLCPAVLFARLVSVCLLRHLTK